MTRDIQGDASSGNAEQEASIEQRPTAEDRERFRFQERPRFLDESVTEQDRGDLRRTPTPEERALMDENIHKLGSLFSGSHVRWQLDGALNISLMKGEYIGVHKDVDLGIEAADLEQLDLQLEQHGYGFFLSSEHPTDDTKRQVERVDAQKFREAPEAHLMIAAVDKRGRIRTDETLNYLDVHLVRRDVEGRPLGHGGVVLPNEWYEPQPTTYQGVEINLSHPAKVAYFKIHGTRPFDTTDLRTLAELGGITPGDVDEIEDVFEQEFTVRRQTAEALLDRIASTIGPEASAEGIYQAFVHDTVIAERLQQDEGARELFKGLADRISETDRSPEHVKHLSFQTFAIEKSFDVQREQVQNLRRWVTESKELAELRNHLSSEE